MGETTNEEGTGATDAGASKRAPTSAAGNSPEPAKDTFEEAHILEEHIVAPAPRHASSPAGEVRDPSSAPGASGLATGPQPRLTPKALAPPAIRTPAMQETFSPPAPVSLIPPTTAVPQPKPVPTPVQTASAEPDIASILQEVKLPERHASEVAKAVAPQKTYDTSLAAEGTTEAKEAARMEALQTARAITESLPNALKNATDNVRALHTLKDDLQEVVRDKKISLVRAVALEEEKRHHGSATEEQREVNVRKEKRTRFGLFIVIVLIVVGLLAIGAVLYVMAERSQKAAAPITAQVLFSEQSVPLPVDTLAAADIRREIGNARTSGALTLGAILQIVPIVERKVNGQSVTVPITFGAFLEKIGSHAPPELGRALSDDFFFGLHTVDENAPVIVIPVTSYERAFAAMLVWEKMMNSDLSPMFTNISMQAVGADGIIRERHFEDTVMRNYDVRALKDDSGQIQLYYSFPTRNILIIAESPYSFAELLTRLRADRRL